MHDEWTKALANTAHFAYRQLPERLRSSTVGVSVGNDGKPILAVFETTREGTVEAVQHLQSNGWNVLDAPHGRTPDVHPERQFYDAGYTEIGISRQRGMCDACTQFFSDKSIQRLHTGMPMQEFVKDIVMRIVYKQSPDVALLEQEVALFDSFPALEIIPILRGIFDQEHDEVVKSRAFDAILSIREFDRVQFLLDLLDQPAGDWRSVGWRLAYCRTLSRFHDARAIGKLCAILLRDPDQDMRYTAAESLATVGDVTAIAALEYAQAHDRGTDFEGFSIAKMASQALQHIRSRAND